MKLSQLRASIGIGLASFILANPLFAIVYVETVEIPLEQAKLAAMARPDSRPLTLSEQYAQSRRGRRYETRSTDQYFSATDRVRIYECPEILDRAVPSNTAIVIDVSKRKAYLMVDGVMGMETEIASPGQEVELPSGWFEITERVKDGRIVEEFDAVMPYWMRLGETPFGIHGGALTGYSEADHCIRLTRPAAATLFEHTEPGTLVYICSNWLDDDPAPSSRLAEETNSAAPEMTKLHAVSGDDSATIGRDSNVPEPTPASPSPAVAVADSPEPTVARAAPSAPKSKPVQVKKQPAQTAAAPTPVRRANSSREGSSYASFRSLFSGKRGSSGPPTKSLTPVSGKPTAKRKNSTPPEDAVRLSDLLRKRTQSPKQAESGASKRGAFGFNKR